MPLPTAIELEIVTPEGLLLREPVDEIVAPGEEGYFGVRPGHTPLMAALGLGELKYRRHGEWHRLTCFSGWCEVQPDRVSILADIGERAGDIDIGRAEQAMKRAAERLKQVQREAGYDEARLAYVRAVTRLAVARKERGGGA
jgi:F-type H+-transporting ATPase subunit epsilon